MLSEDSNRFWAGGGPGGVFTISVAERDVPLMFADSVTVVLALTAAVVTAKLALEAPAGTVTLAGTAAAAGLLLAKGTDNPPAGATFASVTMPCAVSPPMTVVGLTENPSTAGITVTSVARQSIMSTGEPESRSYSLPTRRSSDLVVNVTLTCAHVEPEMLER